MTQTTARIVGLLVAALAAAGCTATENVDATSTGSQCTERPEWGEYIASHTVGGTMTPVETWSVPSVDHDDAYYVAMSFTLPDDGYGTGVWLVEPMSDDESRAQVVLSVNPVAKASTDWFDMADGAWAVTSPDTSAVESCIQD